MTIPNQWVWLRWLSRLDSLDSLDSLSVAKSAAQGKSNIIKASTALFSSLHLSIYSKTRSLLHSFWQHRWNKGRPLEPMRPVQIAIDVRQFMEVSHDGFNSNNCRLEYHIKTSYVFELEYWIGQSDSGPKPSITLLLHLVLYNYMATAAFTSTLNWTALRRF